MGKFTYNSIPLVPFALFFPLHPFLFSLQLSCFFPLAVGKEACPRLRCQSQGYMTTGEALLRMQCSIHMNSFFNLQRQDMLFLLAAMHSAWFTRSKTLQTARIQWMKCSFCLESGPIWTHLLYLCKNSLLSVTFIQFMRVFVAYFSY